MDAPTADSIAGVLREINAHTDPDGPAWDVDDFVVMNTGHWLTGPARLSRSDAARRFERRLYESYARPGGGEMNEFAERVGVDVRTGNTFNDTAPLSNDLQYATFDTPSGRFAVLRVHKYGDARANYTKPFVVELYPSESRIAPSGIEFWCPDCEIGDQHDPYFGWENDGLPSESFNSEENIVECPECGDAMMLHPR